ncbi:hypothetical protein ABKV19_015495 [Rosa sericea]
MGSFCSCFNADDPLDNTHNANNDNRIIPNLYNKFGFGNEETHSSTQLAPNAVIMEHGNTQSGTGTDAATNTSIQSLPGPLLIEKKIGGHRYLYPSTMEEEECPTCLEEYTPENPKITTKCSHHFHLACIYEWLERNQTCPVCSQVMSFNDL